MWSVAAPRSAQIKRDPAPTRIAYRYQRFMLTPWMRRLVTRWIPVLAVIGILAAIVLAPTNRARITAHWAELRLDIENRPEFAVNAMSIEGAGPTLQQQIRALLDLKFPQSRFHMNMDDLRDMVSGLPSVGSVRLSVGTGGVLDVVVVERTPIAIWRGSDGLSLLDAEGVQTAWITTRKERPDLPLIAGGGAAYALDEARALVAALGPLEARFHGLLRRGERRWDVVLDRDQVIMLPAQGAVPALERVAALVQASDILDRDVVALDMRVPQRPTLRMTLAASDALRDLRNTALEGQ